MSDTSQGPGWWLASDGKWYPPQPTVAASTGSDDGQPSVSPASSAMLPVAASPQGFLLTIGDIGVTADHVVTPNGSGPLRGSQWIVTDRTTVTQAIPTWAIVMAVLFALACLLGLLFLLVKESRVSGYVEVSVRTGNVSHMTELPVHNVNDVARYRQMVAQAQGLTA